MLIDRFLPLWSIRQVDRVAVASDPATAWPVARSFDLYEMTFARVLFALRTLPDRFFAALRGSPKPLPRHSLIDDIPLQSPGFRILGEDPGREIVVGSVGKFWRTTIEFASVSPSAFPSFEDPGFGKLAWCIRVDPREGGGSWITIDVRVDATDDASRRKFRRYWFVIGRFSHWIRRSALRLFVRKLGRAVPDARRPLPGDEILPDARVARTHARTIEAPITRVWPWLVQMGGGRAGWYSLDRFDNAGRASARRILPELQSLEAGDLVPATPSDTSGFAVLRIAPPRLLVLGSPALLAPARPRAGRGLLGAAYLVSWAFVLEPIGESATRITVRVRGAYEPTIRTFLAARVALLLHGIMEPAQLRGIQSRAEA